MDQPRPTKNHFIQSLTLPVAGTLLVIIHLLVLAGGCGKKTTATAIAAVSPSPSPSFNAVFITPGTYAYVVPKTVTAFRVRLFGGGGGGASMSTSGSTADGFLGGGGGGYAEVLLNNVIAGQIFQLTVGAGGLPSTFSSANLGVGLAGGASAFSDRPGTTVYAAANGGAGGTITAVSTATAAGGGGITTSGSFTETYPSNNTYLVTAVSFSTGGSSELAGTLGLAVGGGGGGGQSGSGGNCLGTSFGGVGSPGDSTGASAGSETLLPGFNSNLYLIPEGGGGGGAMNDTNQTVSLDGGFPGGGGGGAFLYDTSFALNNAGIGGRGASGAVVILAPP